MSAGPKAKEQDQALLQEQQPDRRTIKPDDDQGREEVNDGARNGKTGNGSNGEKEGCHKNEGEGHNNQDEDDNEEGEEDDEDEDDDDDDEPRLKYAKLTGGLASVYRNGDATSAFLVAGDKMVRLLWDPPVLSIC